MAEKDLEKTTVEESEVNEDAAGSQPKEESEEGSGFFFDVLKERRKTLEKVFGQSEEDEEEEEPPAPTRTEFAPDLPVGFQELWRITEGWKQTFVACYVDFNTLSSDTYNTETDGISSQQKCRRQGEAVLRKAYQEAQEHLNPSCSRSFHQQVYQKLIRRTEESFERGKHCLRLMSSAEGINQEVEEIRKLLNFETFKRELKSALDEEHRRHEHVYKLPSFSHYAEQIQIESDNMGLEDGFLGILEAAFARYTFDGSDAYRDLKDDLQNLCKYYTEEAQGCVERVLGRRYGNRVQELLDLIEKKLEKGSCRST